MSCPPSRTATYAGSEKAGGYSGFDVHTLGRALSGKRSVSTSTRILGRSWGNSSCIVPGMTDAMARSGTRSSQAKARRPNPAAAPRAAKYPTTPAIPTAAVGTVRGSRATAHRTATSTSRPQPVTKAAAGSSKSSPTRRATRRSTANPAPTRSVPASRIVTMIGIIGPKQLGCGKSCRSRLRKSCSLFHSHPDVSDRHDDVPARRLSSSRVGCHWDRQRPTPDRRCRGAQGTGPRALIP